MAPLFSVIIPTFNRGVLLDSTLDSVVAQSFRDFEIIVVDDGSTDNTLEVIARYRDCVTFIRQHRGGPGAARNLGAQTATGDYLAMLDSDDLWFPWTLETFSRVILDYASPTLVTAKVVEFVDETDLENITQESLYCQPFPNYYASYNNNYNTGAGMTVVRRVEFLRIGGYTTRRINGEDHDLTLRLGVARGFIPILRPSTLAYRRHVGGVTTNLQNSIEGSRFLLEQERSGAYPGDIELSYPRRAIITRHVRPISLEALRAGFWTEAWELYRATFTWHLQLGRWKYLTAFALMASMSPYRHCDRMRV